MRLLITAILLLAAAAVADVLFFNGENVRAVWQQANDEGQQIKYAIDSFVHKYIFP